VEEWLLWGAEPAVGLGVEPMVGSAVVSDSHIKKWSMPSRSNLHFKFLTFEHSDTQLLTFLVAFSTFHKVFPSLLRLIYWNSTIVTGTISVGECGRLSQPIWLFGTLQHIYTHLCTIPVTLTDAISPHRLDLHTL